MSTNIRLIALKTHRNSEKDIDQLGKWAGKWGVRFQPVNCNMMQLTRKRIKKINAVYSSEGTVLENVDNIKNLSLNIFYLHIIIYHMTSLLISGFHVLKIV